MCALQHKNTMFRAKYCGFYKYHGCAKPLHFAGQSIKHPLDSSVHLNKLVHGEFLLDGTLSGH